MQHHFNPLANLIFVVEQLCNHCVQKSETRRIGNFFLVFDEAVVGFFHFIARPTFESSQRMDISHALRDDAEDFLFFLR